jgi:hypothetical protein
VSEIGAALHRQTRENLDFLIVCSDPLRNYHVQFPSPGDDHPPSLYCEAASESGPLGTRIGESGAARLRSLGWRDPDRRTKIGSVSSDYTTTKTSNVSQQRWFRRCMTFMGTRGGRPTPSLRWRMAFAISKLWERGLRSADRSARRVKQMSSVLLTKWIAHGESAAPRT